MADAGKEKEGSSTVALVGTALLALAAAGVVGWFWKQAGKAGDDLQRSKGEYRNMVDVMKKPVEEYVRVRKSRGAAVSDTGEDMLTFLDRKARQAQIPAGLLNITRNQNLATGGWTETSYTVTMRSPSKENPVRRDPVVDLLRLVETERRTTKSKNLQLAFTGSELTSATITFSQYQPAAPK